MQSTLTLTFDHDTFRLDVKGEGPAIETFLAMIEQAKRHFEAQLRIQAALQAQAQMAEQKRNAEIASMVTRRGN